MSDKDYSSLSSVLLVEDKLVKLNLGRKRGRPAKKKVKKFNKAFALNLTGGSVVGFKGLSEAEKIYDTCLLMGLEGKGDKIESIKAIEARLVKA